MYNVRKEFFFWLHLTLLECDSINIIIEKNINQSTVLFCWNPSNVFLLFFA